MQKLLKVLVVEDNPAIQGIHKAMLTALNCQTEVASNAKEALEMVSNDHDMILLDIGLPDRSGVEVALEIRSRETNKRTLIVAVSSFAEGDATKSCLLEAGIDQVVRKPLAFEKLEQLLDLSCA
jgi:CheY-like chemotaxis protein